MIRFAALALIALAASAAPAIAQPRGQQIAHQAAVAQGPGGCQEFNAALAQAIATQIRTGKYAEARRLAAMQVPCARR